MIQHLLFMMVAPPLLWLGAPLFPMIRGVPRADPRLLGRPAAPLEAARRGFRGLTHPVAALPLFVADHLALARPGIL